jgi:outer membrane protein assembly factor BamB
VGKKSLALAGVMEENHRMKTKIFLTGKIFGWASVGLAVLLAAGCATGGKKSGLAKYSFYPPAPDEPHVQFLTFFNSSKDFPNSGGGKFMTFLTGKTSGTMVIGKPYGGAASKGMLYACDTANGAVMRMNLAEQKMDALVGVGDVSFASPVNMTVDADGTLYVVDMGLNQLFVLDKDQNLIARLGEGGKMKPMDVAVTKDKIFLADVKSQSVHVLDKATRTNLFDIPRAEDATNGLHKLFRPLNIALDQKGRLYVSDFGAYRIQVYDTDGKFLRSIGGKGDNYGEFCRLKGIAVDHNNIVYAVETGGSMVQMFNEEGRLLMWFGEPSKKQVELFLPAKVIVDYDNVAYFQKYAAPDFVIEHLLIVMNQMGPMKVSVFGFGHKK